MDLIPGVSGRFSALLRMGSGSAVHSKLRYHWPGLGLCALAGRMHEYRQAPPPIAVG